jgi:hypothetical protein
MTQQQIAGVLEVGETTVARDRAQLRDPNGPSDSDETSDDSAEDESDDPNGPSGPRAPPVFTHPELSGRTYASQRTLNAALRPGPASAGTEDEADPAERGGGPATAASGPTVLQIAGVLGVSERTVDRDQAAVRGGPSSVGTERESAQDEDERDASNVGTGPEVYAS